MMYVYSGKCKEGDCGEETPLLDHTGKKLYVGDIVITSTIDSLGICRNCGLSVVVSTKYTSYSDGTHKINENVKYFVMGIKNVDFMNSEEWIVTKVKDHSNCVNGENWDDYGFNYKDFGSGK